MDNTAARPRRWKAWLVTVVGIYPLIVVLVTVVTPLTVAWPAPARLAIIVPVAVAAMTWIVGPLLHRRAAHWMAR